MDHVTPFNVSQEMWWNDFAADFLNESYSDDSVQIELDGQYSEDSPAAIWWDTLMLQRKSVLSDFRRFKVYKWEAHSGNMGFDKYGQLVHFDIWSFAAGATHWTNLQKKPRNMLTPINWADSTGIKDKV